VEALIRCFIQTLQRGEYGKGHEVLEDTWREFKHRLPDESRVLKGLINGATALELLKRGRKLPAQRVWETYLKYRPLIDYVSIEHQTLYLKAATILEEIACKEGLWKSS